MVLRDSVGHEPFDVAWQITDVGGSVKPGELAEAVHGC